MNNQLIADKVIKTFKSCETFDQLIIALELYKIATKLLVVNNHLNDVMDLILKTNRALGYAEWKVTMLTERKNDEVS